MPQKFLTLHEATQKFGQLHYGVGLKSYLEFVDGEDFWEPVFNNYFICIGYVCNAK